MIAEAVSGWEKERLFSTDMVLIALGLAEAVTFPTIPLKVTMNEYVEISKYYGTPKSRSFVNGLLDRLIAKLNEEGMITKEGKGLL
jgi:N utilization substance protein B